MTSGDERSQGLSSIGVRPYRLALNILLPIRAPELQSLGGDACASICAARRADRSRHSEHASDFTVYLLCPEEEQAEWPDLAHIAWLDDEHPGRLAQGITSLLDASCARADAGSTAPVRR